jgi:hypothetical protein
MCACKDDHPRLPSSANEFIRHYDNKVVVTGFEHEDFTAEINKIFLCKVFEDEYFIFTQNFLCKNCNSALRRIQGRISLSSTVLLQEE